ncbi:MAG: hypothetical protein AMJ78_05210 [Omnitrophica WOR_2 bacterium SM23_29]|nr:MAG: hypothetical protein AMJ78_05210 [Omnitrophica WOR_2 bacterium SM23_29]
MGDWESEAVPDFQIFITSLGMQAMVFMGELSNPVTNETKVELPRAKYLIETIAMIKEKTKGNLTYEEQKSVDDMLYTLRLKYAEKAK